MRRAGFTLVEMVGVTFAIGMLLTLSAKVMHQAFSAHRVSLDHLQQMRSIEQFVERWRSDVQSAKEIKPEGESLIVLSERAEFIYSAKDQLVTRTRRQAGQDVGRDQWRLPGRCTLAWVVDESGQMPLVIGKLRFTGESGVSETGLGESSARKDDANNTDANNTDASNTDASNTEIVGPDGLRRAAKGPDGLRSAAKIGFAFDEVEIVARVGVGEMP